MRIIKILYFATLESATLPDEQRTRAELFLYTKIMKYLKEPLSTLQLVELLKERGLYVGNENDAVRCFEHVTYFRFEAYLRPIETDTKSHAYKLTASFEKARSLYEFDMRLRKLLLSAIQLIEISLRSKIINSFSLAYGPMWFLNESLAIDKHKCI